jgi:hypothetical protein
MLTFVTLALALFYVLFAAWLLVYLYRLESIGCACAKDQRRWMIIWWLILSSILNVLLTTVQGIPRYLSLVVMIPLQGIFAVVIIQYVRKLKKDKCDCSAGLERDILFLVGVVDLLVSCLRCVIALAMLSVFLEDFSTLHDPKAFYMSINMSYLE